MCTECFLIWLLYTLMALALCMPLSGYNHFALNMGQFYCSTFKVGQQMFSKGPGYLICFSSDMGFWLSAVLYFFYCSGEAQTQSSERKDL